MEGKLLLKISSNTIYKRLICCLVLLAILVPSVFTVIQMGLFSGEPQLEYRSTVTDSNASVLRIATDFDFCPNSYINGKGELSGLYIEIVTEAANRMGMKPEFKTGEWLECRQMLTDGEVDVLLGLEIFSNMEGTLRTIPICSDELRVFGKTTIDSAASLAGKRVALMARSVIESTYDLQCTYVEYYTNSDILKAVEDGEVDYAICHSAVSSKIIEKNGYDLHPSLTISKSYPALAVSNTRPMINKIRLLEKAVELYQGKLLSSAEGDHWLVHQANHYHLAYMSTVNELLKQLMSLNAYDLIHQYAAMALTIAPENPKAFYWLILSYRKQNMDEMAAGELVVAKQKLPEGEYQQLIKDLEIQS